MLSPLVLLSSSLKHKEMADDYILNEHNKEEFPPSHTAEHLLNQTMIRLFGCERSYNAHVERKKSKMSFHLDHKPTRQEEKEIERRMNELISIVCPTMLPIPSDLCASATTMYVPVSESMYAAHPR